MTGNIPSEPNRGQVAPEIRLETYLGPDQSGVVVLFLCA